MLDFEVPVLNHAGSSVILGYVNRTAPESTIQERGILGVRRRREAWESCIQRLHWGELIRRTECRIYGRPGRQRISEVGIGQGLVEDAVAARDNGVDERAKHFLRGLGESTTPDNILV